MDKPKAGLFSKLDADISLISTSYIYPNVALTKHGKTRQNTAKHGKTRQNTAKHGKTRQNTAKQ
jgi:hypothetical protein